MGIVFAIGREDQGSNPGQVILKTQKIVLDATLLNTQHYKAGIKGKVEQSREKNGTLPLHLSVVAIEKGAFGSPLTKGIVVSEFVLQLRYYVHFRANTLGKGMNPLIFPAMG